MRRATARVCGRSCLSAAPSRPELLSRNGERVGQAMGRVKSAVNAQQHARDGEDVNGGGARCWVRLR